jgi:hypothetical protein
MHLGVSIFAGNLMTPVMGDNVNREIWDRLLARFQELCKYNSGMNAATIAA